MQRALLAAIDTAQGDLDRARANIEAWYDSAMDRLSGWYKRTTHWILFGIALVLAVALNIDTLAIADYLYRQDAAREAVALYDLIDTTPDGIISEAEQNAALAAGYSGVPITSIAQLVGLLNAGVASADDPDGPLSPSDAYLNISEVLLRLKDSFEADHPAAIAALDVDGNGLDARCSQ